MDSKALRFNKTDVKRWLVNLVTFATPIVLIYLAPISAALATPGHVFSLQDFAISSFVAGMMVKQVIDSIIDFLRKFVTDNTKK